MTAIRCKGNSCRQITVPLAELNELHFRFAPGHEVAPVGLWSRSRGILLWRSPQFLSAGVMSAWPARNLKPASVSNAILHLLPATISLYRRPNFEIGTRPRGSIGAELKVRIHFPPAESQVRTCLSREFAFLGREAAVFRGCPGRYERPGSAETRGRRNIWPKGGDISVGPYSSTAPPVMRSATLPRILSRVRDLP